MTNEEAIKFGKEQLEIFGEDSRMSEFIRIAIEDLKSERPKGEWISVEEKDRRESEQKGVTIKTLSYRKLYNCSLCGCDFNSSFKFCPNCGADMRGEE